MSQPKTIDYGCSVKGAFRNICVLDKAGNVVKRLADQENLILDCGMDLIGNKTWESAMSWGVAGTGTADTREAVTGTYSQSGTTVTRDSGSRDFTSADIGKIIKFSTNEESRIAAIGSTTVVTVVESRTVSATTVTLYNVRQVELGTEVKRSNNYPSFVLPDGIASNTTVVTPAAAKVLLRRTFDFTEEVGNVTYSEIGVSYSNATDVPAANWGQSGTTVSRSSGSGTVTTNDIGKLFTFSTGEKVVCIRILSTTSFVGDRSQSVSATTMTAKAALFSRIKLAEPIELEAEQQLRFTYDLTLTIHGVTGVTTGTETADSIGWPVEYAITDIQTDGSKMTVTMAENHHYIAGGKVNLVGVVMPRTAITAADSTSVDFTITAPGHSFMAADSIVIQGVTPSAYNGTFTVDSVSGDDITVSSLLDPGTGTLFGTVRLANPTPWYDGEWTVANVPAANKVEITTAIEPPTPELPEGIVRNNVIREFRMIKGGIVPIGFTTGGSFARAMAGGFSGVTENNQSNILDGAHSLGTGNGQAAYQFFLFPTQPTSFPTKWPATWVFTNATDHLNTSAGTGLSSVNTTTAAITSPVIAAPTLAPYAAGSFLRDTVCAFAAGQINSGNLMVFGMSFLGSEGRGPAAVIIFAERQKKESSHKLTFTLRRRWARELSAEP